MCLDARLLPHKLVNMNMNQHFELNFHREKEHVWGPHVSDTIFFLLSLQVFLNKVLHFILQAYFRLIFYHFQMFLPLYLLWKSVYKIKNIFY